MGRTGRNGQVGSRRLAGRYRLVEKLGAGGMSEVWRGYDETLGRAVAVKVLAPRLAGDQTFRDRLRQEALAAARLCHPHITGVFDFGESPLNERLTVPYVVMELNDGESVAARIARQGPLPWRDALTVAVEVASALATSHARGLVHRDVTPANVMLTGAGAKVVDFGISAIVGQRDTAPDGSLLGTPAYLAPERLGRSQVSAATDVYALGLLLYRTLTGRLPWPAENTTEALRAHLYADPEPLPAIRGMPPAVADLCLRCLTKDPAHRPGAAEVARELGAVIGLQPIIPPVVERATDAPNPVRGAATIAPSRTGSAASGRGRAGSGRSRVGVGRTLLACLGLPGGVPGPRPAARTLRLRAGLKIGAALQLGGARPVGGGLFVGGRLLPGRPGRRILGQAGGRLSGQVDGRLPGQVDGRLPGQVDGRLPGQVDGRLPGQVDGRLPGQVDGRHLGQVDGRLAVGQRRGRRRVQAALVALAVVATAGTSWATSRDTPDVREAQAAGAGVVAAGTGEARCAVRYRLRRDSGRDYEAQLTVATAGEPARTSWRVRFTYPGSQRLTDPPRAVTQKGRKVTAKGHGEVQSFTLRGEYDDYNLLPLAFAVDGLKCRVEVLGNAPANRHNHARPRRDEPGDETRNEHRASRERTGPSLVM